MNLRKQKRGYCGSELIEARSFCSNLSLVCPDPSKYIFFDSIHPIEATYKKVVNYILKKLPKLGKISSTNLKLGYISFILFVAKID